MSMNRLSRFTGMLLGSAVGLALGAYGASEVVASGLRCFFP